MASFPSSSAAANRWDEGSCRLSATRASRAEQLLEDAEPRCLTISPVTDVDEERLETVRTQRQ